MEKQNIYVRISSIALAVFFVVFPLFVLPYSHLIFSYAKVGLVSLCVFVVTIALIIKIINEKTVSRPSWLYISAILAVPVAYLAAAFFSGTRSLSLIGQGADVDTAFIVSLGMLLAAIVASVSKNRKQGIFNLSIAFSGVALVISLFHIVRFIFGPQTLSFGLFNVPMANTIGSFGDLGIYAGLALILAVISLEFLSFGFLIRTGFYLLLVSSLTVVVVTNFNLINNFLFTGLPLSLAFLLAAASLVVFVHKKVISPKGIFPYVAFAVFIVSVLCTVEAKTISNWVVSRTGITPAEVIDIRPAPSDSMSVAAKTLTLGARPALVGIGPNRYFTAWGVFKPVDQGVAATPSAIRHSDFNLGFSYIATTLVTEGLIGFLAWMFFFVTLGYYIYKLFKKVVSVKSDPLSVYSSVVVSVSAVFLWISVILYTPGPVILFLAFFFTGLLFGKLMSEDIIGSKEIKWEEAGYWKSFAIVFSLVIAMAVIVSVAYAWSIKAIASAYADKAVYNINFQKADMTESQRDALITDTQTLMAKAINLNPSSEYLRLYTDVTLVRPVEFLKARTAPVSAGNIPQNIVSDINKALVAAEQAALRTDRGDYRNWIELGKVYETATFLGATTTADLSVQAYLQAETINPTSPIPPFFLGRILIYAKKYDLAKQQLQRALQLSPDYAEARALLNVATNAETAAFPSKNNSVQTQATSTKSTIE